MAGEDASHLRQAIIALYSNAGAAQEQANGWLNAFSRTSVAWEASVQLLDPAERPEVCFFCANMLLSKVRAEWHKLSQEQQAGMGGVISNKFQLFVNQAQTRLAMQRLGLLLAAVASLSGAQACQTFAGQCVGMIAGGEGGQYHMSECALSMLTALAEEINNMDKGRRKELAAATDSQWLDIAGLANSFIPEQMAAGNYGLVHGALLCLQGWLRLSSDPSSSVRMSPGQLAVKHPQLLTCLFNLLGATATEAVTAERIESLACEILCEVLGPGPVAPDIQQERTAVEAAMGALLALRDVALAPGPAGAGVARSVASIASALAQRDPEAVCGKAETGAATTAVGGATSNGAAAVVSGQHVLPLAELMLHCVSRRERAVCEAAVEYFLMVNTLPTEERHPQMVTPLYASLLGPLMRGHACYSPEFVSWNEEVDDDEEAFHRFRYQSLSELLETVYLMTGPSFLSNIQDSINTAQSWQQAEGAFFCLIAVAGPLKGHVTRTGSPYAQQTSELLLALFTDLCNPQARAAAFLSSPYTCATAAGLVGAYAPWFDVTAAAPLEGALRLLLHALCFPYSWHAAAGAFRALCMRCGSRLSNAPLLQGLASLAASAIAPASSAGEVAAYVPMPLEDRQAVVEGLARVVTLLPPQDVVDSALNLQQPHLARTQSIITQGSSTAARGGAAAKQLLQHLADELQLMAILIKGMEFPGQPAAGFVHPAMKLLEAAWPVLSTVADAPVCRGDKVVIEAVCEVHKRAIQTARGAAKPLLITLLKGIDSLFTATQQAACLEVLATLAEVFGEVKNAPDIAEAQRKAFEEVSAAAGAYLLDRVASGQQLSASGDLLRSLLAMADAHLVFARELFLASTAMPQVFQWAVAAVGLREKEPVNAGLGFLSHLLAAAAKVFAAASEAAAAAGAAATPEQQATTAAATQLQSSIQAQGERLVRTLVIGACDTAPRQLLRALAGVLYQMLQSSLTGDAGGRWLLAALQAQDLPGMAAGLLKASDCETLAKLALRQPPLSRGRFDALVMDFAAIPRGEGTSDALLGYEL